MIFLLSSLTLSWRGDIIFFEKGEDFMKERFNKIFNKVQEFNDSSKTMKAWTLDMMEGLNHYSNDYEYLETLQRYINSFIYLNEDSLIPALRGNASIVDMQTKLQSLANQGVFELEQLQGATDSVKLTQQIDRGELSPEEGAKKLTQIQKYLNESKTLFDCAQRAIDESPAKNENCYISSTNILKESAEGLPFAEDEADAQPYKPVISTTQEITDISKKCMNTADEVFTSLLDEVEFTIDKVKTCLNEKSPNLDELRNLGFSYAELNDKLKTAFINGKNLFEQSIEYVFESTLGKKSELLNNQLDIQSELNTNPEYNAKLQAVICDQVINSATQLKQEVLPTVGNYAIPPAFSESMGKIIERQKKLTENNSERV